MNNIRNWN